MGAGSRGMITAIILEIVRILVKPFLHSRVLALKIGGILLAPFLLRIFLSFLLTFCPGAHFLPIFGSGIRFK